VNDGVWVLILMIDVVSEDVRDCKLCEMVGKEANKNGQ
jgi:hypothetical protein